MECTDCKWFYHKEPEDSIGFCHRYPPNTTPIEKMKVSFGGRMHPLVFSDGWCGEFKEKN